MEQFGAFLPLILIFLVFWILLIRPQQKKMKQHREMVNNLKRGDKIVTTGGIIANIIKVCDNKELTIEISENVKIQLAPGMVAELLSKNDSDTNNNLTKNEKTNTSMFSGLLSKKNK